ncbi:hypothetical protein D3C78_1836480 [compost metagenome]
MNTPVAAAAMTEHPFSKNKNGAKKNSFIKSEFKYIKVLLGKKNSLSSFLLA